MGSGKPSCERGGWFGPVVVSLSTQCGGRGLLVFRDDSAKLGGRAEGRAGAGVVCGGGGNAYSFLKSRVRPPVNAKSPIALMRLTMALLS